MNELALLAILALSRCCFMPFLTHFSFVILVNIRSIIQLRITMSICTVSFKFTRLVLHPVLAKLSFIVKSKVFNILNHLFSALKIHLLLGSSISLRSKLIILVLLALNFLNLLHKLIIWMLTWEERLKGIDSWVHSEFIQLSYAREIRWRHMKCLLLHLKILLRLRIV